jgi:hypothetical protein
MISFLRRLRHNRYIYVVWPRRGAIAWESQVGPLVMMLYHPKPSGVFPDGGLFGVGRLRFWRDTSWLHGTRLRKWWCSDE